MDEKLYENIFIYDVSYKTYIGAKPLRIRFDKVDALLEFLMKLGIQYNLALNNIMPFTLRLDII